MVDRSKIPKGEKGFTLVEIIASIVLLAVVLSVFMAIFPQMINWSNAAEKELVTANLTAKVAQDVWENTKYENFTPEKLSEKFKTCDDYTDVTEDLNPGIKKTDDDREYHYELNQTYYKVSYKACATQDDLKHNLGRVHFTIENLSNNRKMDSFAYIRLKK